MDLPRGQDEMVRTFTLYRVTDDSGVSGTGTVAEGAQFTNGTCALVWRTTHGSIGLYPDIDTLISIHGHGGHTRVVWDGKKDVSDDSE